jgi:UDPglucose 6-dehydrogenase
MKIGVVGKGCVGNAVVVGMSKLGHEVFVHDVKLNTKLDDILVTDICFLCLPTPGLENGKCDTLLVEQTIAEIKSKAYDGIIAIKSTVEPGTTQRLQDMYKSHKICFVPEFLRERFAEQDFVENQDLCVVGTNSDFIFKIIMGAHGTLARHYEKMRPTEAELLKYFNNTYNATLITLANSFYEICKFFKMDYSKIKNALIKRDQISDNYLDCNEFYRGFGGVCLPKDLKALNYLLEQENIDIRFIKDILMENDKYSKTVPDGMRLS